MKISGYIPALYGTEYMRQSVEALAPHVDRLIVLYTPEPSFGHRTSMPCPDTEEQLRACCDGVGAKLHWVRGTYGNEGQHRSTVLALAPDADLIVTADTDEVWCEEALARCIREAFDSPSRNFLVQGFEHLWRSFNFVCRDVWGPVRLIKPSGAGDQYIQGRVWHFGYAQAVQTVAYKISCHGHKAEWRPEWWTEIFLANRHNDCHPTCFGWWNAMDYDSSLMPLSLRNHPNFGKEVIQ